ncbi:MAG TPA: cytochrome P450 [Micromonosporaceae bacterium]
MMRLPAPATSAGLGHLPRWTFDPITLLTDGARTGPVFSLRLWRKVVVGYRPDWNRAILGDLDTFRSKGSLSGLSPYLSAGIVHIDVPTHDPRRATLNPHFHSRAIEPLRAGLRTVVDAEMPTGAFDALAWSHRVVRRMLNRVFFAGALPDELLADFFAPLQRGAPAPLLPRPLLFGRLNTAIARVLADPPANTLAAALAGTDHAGEEIRVALAAGYDTTAHTLAWALWHLAGAPQWRHPDLLAPVLDEVLRLYPAGWIGSRVCRRDVHVAGVDVAAGSLVMYSPFLTHRDPELWPEPAAFKPERFAAGKPAWAFIPFSAGRRTCLGAHLARMMLLTALERCCEEPLMQGEGDPAVRTSISLRPAGPLWITR